MELMRSTKWFVPIVIGLASGLASAGETFVDLNLKVGMEVSASGIKRHQTGTVKCNPFGRDPDVEHFSAGPIPVISEAGNGRVKEAHSVRSYPLKVNYADAHWMNPRTLNVTVENTANKDGSQLVSVTFNDMQKLTQSNRNSGDCSDTDWVAKASHDKLSGTLRIGYTMPANTWAVRVIRKTPTELFKKQWKTDKSPTSPIQGDLMNYFDPRVYGAEKIVWATPGSEIFQEISFQDLVNGGPTNGELGIQFVPIATHSVERKGNALKLNLTEAEPAEILSMVEGDLLDLKNSEFKDAKAKEIFINHAVSLIALPDVLNGFTTNSRTDALYRLAGTLEEVAYSGGIGDKIDSVKAAATILAHEVSLNLLRDIGPYCDTKEVDLPFTGEHVSVSGLRLSFFYMSRAKARVENYRFSHYRAYLDQLRSYEAAKLTYSAVRNDKTKLEQMQKAYEALKTALDGRSTPFRGALDEMRYVLSMFKSVGAGEQATQEIFERLTTLAGQEEAFVRDFILRLRQFRASNNSVVLASDLLARLSEIETSQEAVIQRLDGNVRLLSLDGNASVDSFIGMIQSLISHNVNLFSKPMPNSAFERIRAVYLNEERVTKIVKQANKCILEGVTP